MPPALPRSAGRSPLLLSALFWAWLVLVTDLLFLATVTVPDWSPGATALEKASTPIFAILVIALIIGFAIAFYRVVTGKNLGRDDD